MVNFHGASFKAYDHPETWLFPEKLQHTSKKVFGPSENLPKSPFQKEFGRGSEKLVAAGPFKLSEETKVGTQITVWVKPWRRSEHQTRERMFIDPNIVIGIRSAIA